MRPVMPMFELVQEMMFVNTCVKFRHNRLINEVCRAVTPLGHVQTNVRMNVHTGRSLYTLRGYNKASRHRKFKTYKYKSCKHLCFQHIMQMNSLIIIPTITL